MFAIEQAFNHSEIYGLTGTLAYEIVENLTVRGEVRWDYVVGQGYFLPEEFLTTTFGGSTYQIVGLAQVVYAF